MGVVGVKQPILESGQRQVSKNIFLSGTIDQGGDGAASTAAAARGCALRNSGLTQQMRFVLEDAFLSWMKLHPYGYPMKPLVTTQVKHITIHHDKELVRDQHAAS